MSQQKHVTFADFEAYNWEEEMNVDPIVDTNPIEGECVGPNEGKCFMMRKVLHAQATIDKHPQKESNSHTKCTICLLQ